MQCLSENPIDSVNGLSDRHCMIAGKNDIHKRWVNALYKD
ncbi:hypothetical protein HMPREF9370_1262 [Neisseria wadsworthii 9715]|uniref:Uncharacterized protein n=1 Tax=Neisseria wadsworthii 9715 TaxID=1030841 RepID=G4CQA2_9NEIS|nr:hypothetical protein HMPREF9370_1262 [Neisseria wadsworthii 9715]